MGGGEQGRLGGLKDTDRTDTPRKAEGGSGTASVRHGRQGAVGEQHSHESALSSLRAAEVGKVKAGALDIDGR